MIQQNVRPTLLLSNILVPTFFSTIASVHGFAMLRWSKITKLFFYHHAKFANMFKKVPNLSKSGDIMTTLKFSLSTAKFRFSTAKFGFSTLEPRRQIIKNCHMCQNWSNISKNQKWSPGKMINHALTSGWSGSFLGHVMCSLCASELISIW